MSTLHYVPLVYDADTHWCEGARSNEDAVTSRSHGDRETGARRQAVYLAVPGGRGGYRHVGRRWRRPSGLAVRRWPSGAPSDPVDALPPAAEVRRPSGAHQPAAAPRQHVAGRTPRRRLRRLAARLPLPAGGRAVPLHGRLQDVEPVVPVGGPVALRRPVAPAPAPHAPRGGGAAAASGPRPRLDQRQPAAAALAAAASPAPPHAASDRRVVGRCRRALLLRLPPVGHARPALGGGAARPQPHRPASRPRRPAARGERRRLPAPPLPLPRARRQRRDGRRPRTPQRPPASTHLPRPQLLHAGARRRHRGPRGGRPHPHHPLPGRLQPPHRRLPSLSGQSPMSTDGQPARMHADHAQRMSALHRQAARRTRVRDARPLHHGREICRAVGIRLRIMPTSEANISHSSGLCHTWIGRDNRIVNTATQHNRQTIKCSNAINGDSSYKPTIINFNNCS